MNVLVPILRMGPMERNSVETLFFVQYKIEIILCQFNRDLLVSYFSVSFHSKLLNEESQH